MIYSFNFESSDQFHIFLNHYSHTFAQKLIMFHVKNVLMLFSRLMHDNKNKSVMSELHSKMSAVKRYTSQCWD